MPELTEQERLMLDYHRKMEKHHRKVANRHFDEAIALLRKSLDKQASE